MHIQKKRFICIIIMLVLMFFFGFIPAPDPITTEGMRTLGIFFGMIFGWIFVDIATPSLIALVALAIVNVSDMTSVLAGSIGSQTVCMLIAILFLTALIDQSGLGKGIVYWMLRWKIVKGHPYLLLMVFGLAAFLMTMIGSGYATILIMIALVKELNDIAHYKVGSRQVAAFLTISVAGAVLGELSLPIKSGPVIYYAVVADYFELNGLRYIAAAIPVILVLICLFPLFARFIMRVDLSGLEDVSTQLVEGKEYTFDRDQKKALIVTIVFLAALLVTALPLNFPWFLQMKGLGVGGLALGVMGAMWLIRVDSKPLLDVKGLAKDFNWQVIFMAGAIIFGISALTAESTGVTAFIVKYLSPVLSGRSIYFTIVLLVVVSCLITNFLNNSVVGSLMLGVGVTLTSITAGLSIPGMFVIIPMAAYCSVAMPSANGVCAMAFSQSDLVTPKSMMKFGWCTLVYLIVLLCLLWPYIHLVMG